MSPERIASAIESLHPLLDSGFTVGYAGGSCLQVWHGHKMRYIAIESIESAEDPCLYVRDVLA